MNASGKNPKAFYDGFPIRLLRDYLYLNPRVTAALDFLFSYLSQSPRTILDIGCGIGWVSYEMHRRFPGAEITAVDLSPNLIATAKRVFQRPGITYSQMDVTTPAFLEQAENTYDLIVMVDVYEHIPDAAREAFNATLGRLLTPTGKILITTPTPAYQQYLRDHEPEGLQPVDEDITLATATELAGAVGGRLRCFAEKTVWRELDYQHICVDRGQPDLRNPAADFSRAYQPEALTARLARLAPFRREMDINYRFLLKNEVRKLLGKKNTQ